ncbi:hypothetical protein MKW98_001278 [Papaver atlanticum]|uniref:Uncharacterized protein n=1 Tax=Papaver atlanticum TaxID=357466 RepID=A0AAD4XID6_9MAGN|nr:hypothetical protein MKW98_001278 [Papaver atlanticum]
MRETKDIDRKWKSIDLLDDISWDEVGESDDRIVHLSLRSERIRLSSSNGIQGRVGVKYIKGPMLENNFWSGSPEGLSLDSGDTNLIQEIANFACTDAKLSNNCFLDNNIMSSSGNALYGNVMFDEKLAASDSSFSRFQLGDLTPTDNKFCAGEEEQKDSTNLLYYGWPDIGNLEDVEKMFSCDSTYGQGNASYDNEVSWLSSPVDSSDDALRSSFNSSISEWKSTSKQSEGNTEYLCSSVTPSSTNFGKQNVFDTCWTNSQNLGADDSSSECPSFCNMVDIDVEDRRLSISNEQVSAFALGHAPMEMSPNFPPEVPSIILEENIAKHNQYEHMQVSYTTAYQHEDSVIQQAQSQTSLTDQVPVGGKLHQSLNAVELLSIEVPAVSDTSTVPGNPCDSTFLDDVSVEASGLRQLLCIMKQVFGPNHPTGVCDGSLSLESSSVVHGSITSQHLIPNKLLYEEEHSGGMEEISEY